MNAIQVKVRTATRRTEYPILIADHLATNLGEHLERLAPRTTRIVVSSPRVWALHGADIERALPNVPVVLAADGERAKHLRTVARVHDGLLDARADRRTVMVVVGGGVLGDLAGFAAATFLRGMPVVQVPTTVVAQVDSAIGGKVGVNHARGKNLIGAFHPPLAVLIDPQLLTTLPSRELQAGVYEVIKYGVIASPRLFRRLERDIERVLGCDAAVFVPVIAECARIKARVVSIDEHETGLRRILNFGHTLGHAFEAVTGYRRFLHGEAIGWGMIAAVDVARARGDLDERAADRIVQLIERAGPRPPVADLSADACVVATRRDKKVVAGTLHFVLAEGIGRTRVANDVTELELLRSLRTARISAVTACARTFRVSRRGGIPSRSAAFSVSPSVARNASTILRRSTSRTTRRVASSSVPERSSCLPGVGGRRRVRRQARLGQVEMPRLDGVPVRQDDRALETVLELTHIPRPGIVHQQLQRLLAQLANRLVQLRRPCGGA